MIHGNLGLEEPQLRSVSSGTTNHQDIQVNPSLAHLIGDRLIPKQPAPLNELIVSWDLTNVTQTFSKGPKFCHAS